MDYFVLIFLFFVFITILTNIISIYKSTDLNKSALQNVNIDLLYTNNYSSCRIYDIYIYIFLIIKHRNQDILLEELNSQLKTLMNENLFIQNQNEELKQESLKNIGLSEGLTAAHVTKCYVI